MYITKLDGSLYKSIMVAKAAACKGNRTRRALVDGEFKIEKKDNGYMIKVDDTLDISLPVEEATDNVVVEDTCKCSKEEHVEEKSTVEFTGDFRPIRLLSVIDKFRKIGRRYKWVNTKIDGNIEKKLSEGWVIDHDIAKRRNNMPSEFRDNTQSLDTTTRLRELILMWVPEEFAIKRTKYYRDLANNRLTQDTNQLKSELQTGGGSMHGSVQIGKC